MPRYVFQWCTLCRKVENYPACVPVSMQGRPRNAQVGENEASKVAIHPQTGEVVYCFTKPGDVMPQRYKDEGFEEKSFTSYRELERFCRQNDLVNDIEGDWHHNDGYGEEMQRIKDKSEKQRYEKYMDEREKVIQAYPELRKRGI